MKMLKTVRGAPMVVLIFLVTVVAFAFGAINTTTSPKVKRRTGPGAVILDDSSTPSEANVRRRDLATTGTAHDEMTVLTANGRDSRTLATDAGA